MGYVKQQLIEEQERSQALRQANTELSVPIDAINTLNAWINETLQVGEGVSAEMEWDLVRLGASLDQVKRYLT